MISGRVARLFFGYVLTGGSAAVFDLGGFAVFHRLGAPIAIAASASFLIAALENFVLTSLYVYREPLALRRFGAFLLVATGGFLVNVGVTVATASVTGAPPVIAKLCGIGTAFGVNFVLNTVLVFNRKLASGERIQASSVAAPIKVVNIGDRPD
jgi:putative flippase GtrA